MPIFSDDSADTFKVAGSGYQFSGVNISTLGASEYTLVGIATDRSTSVHSFGAEIERCVKEVFKACQHSPRVDNLLGRVIAFGSDVEEIHGFRPLADCHLDKYDGFLNPGGATKLYDGCIDLIDSMAVYGKALQAQDFTANGIAVVISDGADYKSFHEVHHVKEALQRARMSEALESIVTLLIGVNVKDPDISKALAMVQKEAGFDKYVEAANADAKTIAKIVEFISKSISAQSQSVGSGGPSQLITF